MNFQKYLGNIFVTPYVMIKNVMTHLKMLQMLKKCYPNARNAENTFFV